MAPFRSTSKALNRKCAYMVASAEGTAEAGGLQGLVGSCLFTLPMKQEHRKVLDTARRVGSFSSAWWEPSRLARLQFPSSLMMVKDDGSCSQAARWLGLMGARVQRHPGGHRSSSILISADWGGGSSEASGRESFPAQPGG